MRPRAATALALLVTFGALACDRIEALQEVRRSSGSDRPNVVLVTIDTLRADHVGVYGDPHAETPVLDALAARGTRFQTAIAPTPLTLPSHASLFTGRYPPAHGVRHNGLYRLRRDAVTLAERLKKAGYATGAVVGAAVLARRYGLDQGFDRYDDALSRRRSSESGFRERRAQAVTDRALAWLRDAPAPVFLWVHYFDPHGRYDPPSPFRERFAGRPYDGEVAYVDRELGRLLSELRAQGRRDGTLVVVTADHGESLGEHGEATHSYTLYDATLQVPLVWQGAGIPQGRVVEGVVSIVDVAPTILARLGLEPLADGDGRDLAPLWSSAHPPSARAAYAETHATRLDHGWSPLAALRTGEFLYVRAPRAELYAVATDPGQLRNLLEVDPGSWSDEVERLERSIDSVLARERPGQRVRLDAATRRELQALGYAVADGPVATTEIDPKDGLVWSEGFLQALVQFEQGLTDEPAAFADRMLAALPASASAHSLKARALLRRHRPEQALGHAEEAARLVPRSAEYQVLVGEARTHARDPEGAIRAFEQASVLDPLAPDPEIGLLWVKASLDRVEEAELHARRAVELDPHSVENRIQIADLWEHLGYHERALGAYQSAAAEDPGCREAHAGLWIELVRFGRDAEAERERKRAGPEAERAPHLRNRLAIAYADRGEPERAEAILRDLMARSPDYPTARRNLAHLLRVTGRRDEAERLERP